MHEQISELHRAIARLEARALEDNHRLGQLEHQVEQLVDDHTPDRARFLAQRQIVLDLLNDRYPRSEWNPALAEEIRSALGLWVMTDDQA